MLDQVSRQRVRMHLMRSIFYRACIICMPQILRMVVGDICHRKDGLLLQLLTSIASEFWTSSGSHCSKALDLGRSWGIVAFHHHHPYAEC